MESISAGHQYFFGLISAIFRLQANEFRENFICRCVSISLPAHSRFMRTVLHEAKNPDYGVSVRSNVWHRMRYTSR
jgi:hypothetical protein